MGYSINYGKQCDLDAVKVHMGMIKCRGLLGTTLPGLIIKVANRSTPFDVQRVMQITVSVNLVRLILVTVGV